MASEQKQAADHVQSQISQIDSILQALNTGTFDATNMAAMEQLTTARDPQPPASRSPGLALISQFNDQSDESSDSEETSSSDEDGESADGNEKEDPLGVHLTAAGDSRNGATGVHSGGGEVQEPAAESCEVQENELKGESEEHSCSRPAIDTQGTDLDVVDESLQCGGDRQRGTAMDQPSSPKTEAPPSSMAEPPSVGTDASKQPYTGEFISLASSSSQSRTSKATPTAPSSKGGRRSEVSDGSLGLPKVKTPSTSSHLPDKLDQLRLTPQSTSGISTSNPATHSHGGLMTSSHPATQSRDSHMMSDPATEPHDSHVISDRVGSEMLQIDSFLKALNTGGGLDVDSLPTVQQQTASAPSDTSPPHQPSAIQKSMDYSSGSSDSDSSSSSEDEEPSVRRERAAGSDSDREEGEGQGRKVGRHGYPMIKGEVDYRDLPPVDVTELPFPENGRILPIGKVSHITEKLVVVESIEGTPAVNEGTILWSEEKKSIATVFETFGPVRKPFYSVRVNSSEQAETLGLTPGRKVYVVPGSLDVTHYVFTKTLLEEKGTDASWKNDTEIPAELKDYSDDESEHRAHRKKQGKGRNKGDQTSSTQQKHRRVTPSSVPPLPSSSSSSSPFPNSTRPPHPYYQQPPLQPYYHVPYPPGTLPPSQYPPSYVHHLPHPNEAMSHHGLAPTITAVPPVHPSYPLPYHGTTGPQLPQSNTIYSQKFGPPNL